MMRNLDITVLGHQLRDFLLSIRAHLDNPLTNKSLCKCLCRTAHDAAFEAVDIDFYMCRGGKAKLAVQTVDGDGRRSMRCKNGLCASATAGIFIYVVEAGPRSASDGKAVHFQFFIARFEIASAEHDIDLAHVAAGALRHN